MQKTVYPHISLIAFNFLLTPASSSIAEQWRIPLAGNAFSERPNQRSPFDRSGRLTLSDERDRFLIYFHVDRSATLNLAIEGSSRTRAQVVAHCGEHTFQTEFNSIESQIQTLGEIPVPAAGYQQVDLTGKKDVGSTAELTHLIVSSNTPNLRLAFVRDNQGGMFYWGRRGPSVHLRYAVPRHLELTCAYTEVTVPEDQDPVGSYYMANGFAEGYFGFQVNSPLERRVLFSVWSPFKTDDPSRIPLDQQVVALAKGEDVHIGKFGNEGSGGQSYLVYPWETGKTYRFLTRVEPDGHGQTVYTSWFGDKSQDEWRMIASFRRPKTETYLRGFHSFLESFSPNLGHIGRRAWYGNVWVQDTTGQWHECTQARFTVDATGRGRHRLDFAGGSEDGRFYMQNCGFFNETVLPDQNFTRSSTASERPKITFARLPKGD